MRTTFIEALCELAANDERIWLLNGDLGYSVLERFAERFPNRYLNAGVAEQNMTGIAAGLALSRKIVFTYSIANFPVIRCLEQIRNDVCYHNLNVKIVAVGGGLAYGSAGYTHFAVEDLAVMRAMPNMTVVAPGDPVETKLATRAIASCDGPCYLRLGKAGEPIVHRSEPDFKIGRGIWLRRGIDVTLISTGGMLKAISDSADLLANSGLSAGVLSMPTVKPLDTSSVLEAARATPLLFVAEEHRQNGGLGESIAHCLATSALAATPRLLCANLENLSAGNGIGDQKFLLTQAGLSAEAMTDRVVALVKQSKPAASHRS